jgi:hypothetical protein
VIEDVEGIGAKVRLYLSFQVMFFVRFMSQFW